MYKVETTRINKNVNETHVFVICDSDLTKLRKEHMDYIKKVGTGSVRYSYYDGILRHYMFEYYNEDGDAIMSVYSYFERKEV